MSTARLMVTQFYSISSSPLFSNSQSKYLPESVSKGVSHPVKLPDTELDSPELSKIGITYFLRQQRSHRYTKCNSKKFIFKPKLILVAPSNEPLIFSRLL